MQPLVRRQRPSRNMAMYPLARIGGHEWQAARQHLVKNHAKCVEVAAGVHGPIDPPGLLGRHVGKRACN
jgi:hypothetical protein